MKALQRGHDGLIDNVRGRGLMCAFDAPSRAARDSIIARCFEQRLLVLPCGTRGVRFRPALTVDSFGVEECLTRLGRVLEALLPKATPCAAPESYSSGLAPAQALG